MEKTGFNLVLDRTVSGTIKCKLKDVDIKQGIKVMLETNGLETRESEGIMYISKVEWEGAGKEGGAPNASKKVSLTVRNALVSLEVTNQSIAEIIKGISNQSNINIVIYGNVKGTISAKLEKVNIDDALQYLLKNSGYTFWKSKNIYFIGDATSEQTASSDLIKLKYIKADDVIELMPKEISTRATLKIIKEQNGLIVIGSVETISSAQEYIRLIDQPIPQILLEAMVIDFSITKMRDIGLKLFTRFDSTIQGNSYYPDIDVTGSGTDISKSFNKFSEWSGLKQVVKLPSDFRARLSMLERKGIANVLSTPQIATLNGNTASISVGTTQYFLLKSSTISGANNPVATESEHFETIEATVSLSITPWVTASREVTVQVNPVFQIPGVSPDPGKIPPTINKRELKSTIRLKDGETFILGGLIENSKTDSRRQVPFLGSIPYLGVLFRSTVTTESKNRLMIFLTPHIYYGAEGAVNSDNLIKQFME